MRRDWITCLVLFLVTFAVFSRVLVAGFVQWDDDINIYTNLHIQGLSAANLHWIFTTCDYPPRYVLLSWLGWAINYQLGGLNPAGFHLTDLLFHAANASLVFMLIRRFLLLATKNDSGDEQNHRVRLCSAMAACLWAVHPFRVESFAWAAGRNYVQSFFFLSISVLCYLRFLAEPAQKVPGKFYWISILCFGVSLLSYPIGLPLVVILVVLDFYPLRRFKPGLAGLWDATAYRIWLEKVPYAVVAFLVLEATLLLRASNSALGPPLSLVQFGIGARAMQAFYIWAYYLWKPWVPFHLCPVYTTLVQFNAGDWPFLLSAGLVFGLTFLAVWNGRRWPLGLALWICYLALLVPFLGLTEHPHYPNDRYTYLPAVLWSVLLAAPLLKLCRRPWMFGCAAAALIFLVAVLGAMSVRQIRIWRNSISLFEYMVRELGEDPRRSDLRRHLGRLYADEERIADAVQQFQTSLRLKPDPKTYQALAELFEKHGDAQGALTNYQALLELSPDPLIHLRAAAQLSELGRTGEAIGHYRQALHSQPELVPAIEKLAWLLATGNDAQNRSGAEAVQWAERACALTHHQSPAALGALAAAYAEVGRFSEAIVTARSARDRAQAAGEPKLAEKYRRLIEMFEAGR